MYLSLLQILQLMQDRLLFNLYKYNCFYVIFSYEFYETK